MFTFRRQSGSAPGGDPYFNNVVLLVHGNGANGGTVFTDSSPYNRTAAVTGNVTTFSDGVAFLGSSILFTQGAPSYVEYTAANFLDSTTDAYTVECFIDLDVFGSGGYTSGNNNFLRLTHSAGTRAFEFASQFAGAFIAADVAAFSQTPAPATLLSRVHMAFCRQAGASGGGSWFINGDYRTPGPGGVNYNFDTVRIGNSSGNPSESAGGKISEVRITKGVVRYPGTATFTPPTASFPNF